MNVTPTYFDWRTRKIQTIGSTNTAATIKADTVYTPTLSRINESDALQWDLWPTASNAPPVAVEDVGFFWWDANKQRYIRTSTLKEYTQGLPESARTQGWQLNPNAFTTYGNPNVQRLQYFDGTVNPTYAYQGNYRAYAESLILDADEWQALFAGGGDVELAGLGLLVKQYGNGVTVTEAADGSYTLVSDVAGGIADIVPIGDTRQIFSTLGDLTLDDLAIAEASQRQTSPVFGLLETNSTRVTNPSKAAGSSVPASPQPVLDLSPQSPVLIVQNATLPLTSPLQQATASNKNASSLNLNQSPITILSTPLPALGDVVFQDKPKDASPSTRLPTLITAPIMPYPDETESVLARRMPQPIPNGSILSITDDPSSQSEERQRESRSLLTFSNKKDAQDDMLKREASANTTDVRRLRAMELREYLGV